MRAEPVASNASKRVALLLDVVTVREANVVAVVSDGRWQQPYDVDEARLRHMLTENDVYTLLPSEAAGKAKNIAFETTKGSKFQKDWLHDYDVNLAKKGGKP